VGAGIYGAGKAGGFMMDELKRTQRTPMAYNAGYSATRMGAPGPAIY